MSNKVERDDIDHLHINGIYLPTRTITLMDDVDQYTAAEVINNLHVLTSKNKNPIQIQLMSFGGCENSMFSIYDAIDTCGAHTTITAYGYAMSAATVIMQAGDERIISPNSRFMIHYGSGATDWLHSRDFEELGRESMRVNEMMEDIYLTRIKEKHPRFTRKKLQELMKYDKYMSAKETIDLGLADKILGE